MKKTIIIIIGLALLLIVGYYLVSKRPSPQGPPQKSEVFYVYGKAMLKRKDSAEWNKLERDMEVKDGDVVSTSDNSAVEIKFGEKQKNIIACKDNTEVALENIDKKGDKKIAVEKGRLISLIAELDPDSKFEVKTPTAVCGVLGTGFATEVSEDTSVVKVYEGKVEVKNRPMLDIAPMQKRVVVEEGTMTRIEKNKTPEAPAPLNTEELKGWQDWKGDLDSHLFRIFYVFLDEDSPENHYYPSGWVGDYDAIRRVSWEQNPRSGKNCLKFRYTAEVTQGAGWAGVYWQNPVNNWGDIKGGYNLKGAKKLTFWGRGEKGGETIARFGIGGIGGQYPDSAKVEIGPVVLEKEWREYTIELSDKDTSYISSGFYWMTDKTQNPEGAVFYIDEIKYE